jgi:hypothetical protein
MTCVEKAVKFGLAVIAAHAADIGLPAEVDRLQCAALDAGMRLMWLVQEGAMGII